MANYRGNAGRLAEDIACRYLWCSGYIIRERNVYFRDGEVDIVAEKFGVLYLIEVRSKISDQYSPEDSLGFYKKNQLLKTAEEYCYSVSHYGKYEIEFIAVEFSRNLGVKRLTHYTNMYLELGS
jgi:putative endonuclease